MFFTISKTRKKTKPHADHVLADLETAAKRGTKSYEELCALAPGVRQNYTDAGVRPGYVTSAVNKRIKDALKTAIKREFRQAGSLLTTPPPPVRPDTGLKSVMQKNPPPTPY